MSACRSIELPNAISQDEEQTGFARITRSNGRLEHFVHETIGLDHEDNDMGRFVFQCTPQ
jgi:hypothetical protein